MFLLTQANPARDTYRQAARRGVLPGINTPVPTLVTIYRGNYTVVTRQVGILKWILTHGLGWSSLEGF